MNNIFLVVGARPNFVKAAALLDAAKKEHITIDLIHTGQHYDYNMNEIFFNDLGLVDPMFNFGLSTALDYGTFLNSCILRFTEIFLEHKPKLVIVVGDVVSSLAAAMAARDTQTILVHVEAGLRSFDYTMPEELNRIIIDSISDFFFVTEPSGVANLKREGKEENVFLVGNTMIDTLYKYLPKIKKIHESFDLKLKKYAVVTLHRQDNVAYKLQDLLESIDIIGNKLPIIFPIHPRTKQKLGYVIFDNIKFIDPLGYVDFLSLMYHSKFVMTDSGGIQEETTALNIPCLYSLFDI